MLKRLGELLRKKPMTLIVSLAQNDADLANAAIEACADCIKIHSNTYHRASGNTFGPAKSYQSFIQMLRKKFDGPIGVVPGDQLDKVTRGELQLLEEYGCNFYSIYAHHHPSWMLEEGKWERTYAISNLDPILLGNPSSLGITALEASIIPGEEYGSQLRLDDLLKYQFITKNTDIPVLVPSQRRLLPSDIRPLHAAGVKGVLLGAVVTGNKPESIYDQVSQFRKAIDTLG
jgi:hypothetical protein